MLQDSNSLRDHLIASQSHRAIRIASQQELQQRQQRKQQKINARRNSSGGIGSTAGTGTGNSGSGSGGGESGGTDEHPNSKTNNSPSPRTKHNRKQAKGIETGTSIFISHFFSLSLDGDVHSSYAQNSICIDT